MGTLSILIRAGRLMARDGLKYPRTLADIPQPIMDQVNAEAEARRMVKLRAELAQVEAQERAMADALDPQFDALLVPDPLADELLALLAAYPDALGPALSDPPEPPDRIDPPTGGGTRK